MSDVLLLRGKLRQQAAFAGEIEHRDECFCQQNQTTEDQETQPAQGGKSMAVKN